MNEKQLELMIQNETRTQVMSIRAELAALRAEATASKKSKAKAPANATPAAKKPKAKAASAAEERPRTNYGAALIDKSAIARILQSSLSVDCTSPHVNSWIKAAKDKWIVTHPGKCFAHKFLVSKGIIARCKYGAACTADHG